MHGVKTMQNRRKLIEKSSIQRWTWIGASDIATEGNWTWVNGERAPSSEIFWRGGVPGYDDYDCVYMVGTNEVRDVGLAGHYTCTLSDRRLCEKRFKYYKYR